MLEEEEEEDDDELVREGQEELDFDWDAKEEVLTAKAENGLGCGCNPCTEEVLSTKAEYDCGCG